MGSADFGHSYIGIIGHESFQDMNIAPVPFLSHPLAQLRVSVQCEYTVDAVLKRRTTQPVCFYT